MKTATIMCKECNSSFTGYVHKRVKSMIKFVNSCKHHHKIKNNKRTK